jgi:hypothetical protein
MASHAFGARPSPAARRKDWTFCLRKTMLKREFNRRRNAMTLCPIAIVAGCKKCPAFSVCPLKTVIGDVPKNEAPAAANDPKK